MNALKNAWLIFALSMSLYLFHDCISTLASIPSSPIQFHPLNTLTDSPVEYEDSTK